METIRRHIEPRFGEWNFVSPSLARSFDMIESFMSPSCTSALEFETIFIDIWRDPQPILLFGKDLYHNWRKENVAQRMYMTEISRRRQSFDTLLNKYMSHFFLLLSIWSLLKQ
jgi:hypothetical protein